MINFDEKIKYDQNESMNTEWIYKKQEKEHTKLKSENYKKGVNRKKVVISLLLIVFLIAIIISIFIYFLPIPIVNLNGSSTETIDVGETYIDKGVNAYTKFKSINDKVIVEGNVNTSKIGEYTITYKVPYFNGYKEYTRIVSVVDKKAPEIKLDGDENYTINYGTEFIEPGYHAVDNYDGDLTEKVEIEKVDKDSENYEITYTVKDSSNNIAKTTRNIKVVDKEAPKITLNGNPVVSVIIGKEYKENGASATDNKDGDVSSKIKISGNVDTSKEGTYVITYSVEDSSGNSSQEQRKVIVNSVEKAGIIYLTIDDGPSTTITPQILDVLKEKGVHATFFILNYGDGAEYLVKRELDEGNSIGIHGYSHNYADIYTSVDTCYQNITKLQQKIYNSTGKTIKIVRFPGGSSNTISKNYCEGVMSGISEKILSEGFKYYDWNVDSCDAGGAKTKEEVFNNVTSNLKHGRSNVVLMHDFSGNTKTLEALPEIIDYGLENGYVFDVITEETPMVTHSILN